MICEATFGETPAWSSQVAAVCRASWRPVSGDDNRVEVPPNPEAASFSR
jgi:hypothetical protein